MKVKGLDGKKHVWNLGKYVGQKNNNASALHKRVREFLRDKFPSTQILEEVHTPEGLYLDFYIPIIKTAIECQGRQHDEYVPFFHRTKADFKRSQTRDERKSQFCELNGIALILFYPGETEDEWNSKL